MKKILILILPFLPITLLSQELKCCESIKEVETFLKGNWKKTDSEPDLEYRFELKNGTGRLKVTVVHKYKTLEKSEDKQPNLKILKTEKRFEIEHDFGGLKTYPGLKYLNSKKLIVTRKDGAEREYYKVLE